MPNPDGSLTAAERQKALLAVGTTPATGVNAGAISFRGRPGQSHESINRDIDKHVAEVNENIARGAALPGAYSMASDMQARNGIESNLSNAEAQVKIQGDFGLGSNNNAQTAAMLGNAQATGDKYAERFGRVAANAGLSSVEAGARGLDVYQGDTSNYQQGLANAQDSRDMQTDAYGRLMAFADGGHAKEGPSAAQAQLNQATDANLSNTLALARSGRGMGGSQAGLRQAMNQNAVTQQQAANQSAVLRAGEAQAFRGEQLQTRAQQLQALSAAGGVATQTVGTDQAYGQLGLAGAQYTTDAALKGTQLNDASSQAWAAQQQAALSQGLGADVGAQTQQLNINSTALAGRESQHSSQNQLYGIGKGIAANAAIADANRQQAYVGAGVSAAGAVIGAVSDERAKTNITPLGAQPVPLPSQSGGPVVEAPAGRSGPTNAQVDEQRKEALGSNIGKLAGAGIGTAVAGPIGGIVGSVAGGVLGKMIGSDVRSKTNIRPLDEANPYGGGAQPSGSYEQLQALANKYGAGGVADKPKTVDKYERTAGDKLASVFGSGLSAFGGSLIGRAPEAPKQKPESGDEKPRPVSGDKAYARFARDESHPILSEGDALLADSARNAPGSLYEYKDKRDGAGTYAGPMAQDLAAHPITRGAVGKDPSTGKLVVDGARAATVGLAQNHAQQNQLDVLDAKIAELQSLLKRKPGDEKPTSFSTSTGGL